jgi:hypothetical protein
MTRRRVAGAVAYVALLAGICVWGFDHITPDPAPAAYEKCVAGQVMSVPTTGLYREQPTGRPCA